MKQIFEFAGDHPILTLVMLSMLLGTAVRLVPWARKEDQ